jgi:hypothetical protein
VNYLHFSPHFFFFDVVRNHFVCVILTALFNQEVAVVLFATLDHGSPNLREAKSFRIANQEQKVLRPSDCNIQPTEVSQEAQTLRQSRTLEVVATNAVKDHHVLFLTLECINCVNCNITWSTLKLSP